MNAHAPITLPADNSIVEIEQALIGTCLLEPNALSACGGLLDAEHFSESVHQQLWTLMETLVRAGSVANPVTICAKMGGNFPIAEGLTLSAYLARCCSSTFCPPAYAADFAKQIRAAWALREVVVSIETAKVSATSVGADAKAIVADLMQQLDETRLRMDPRRAGFRSASEVTTSVVDQMAQHYAGTVTLRAITTGLKDLDHKLMGGFRGGDLVIMAGRPGMGKSLSAVSISRQSAFAGHPGAFYSLEMAREQIGARFLSDHAYRQPRPLSSGQILNGKLSEAEAEHVCNCAREFAELPLHIDDSSGMSVGEISARSRSLADRLARKGQKLKHVWIDYLKFVRATERYRGQRHYEVGEISAGLKALAKDLDVAVILLAQLNRGVESREDKKPQLSDLRESGDLEADADVVIFLYREAYYLSNKEPRPGSEEHLQWQTEMSAVHNKIEIIIAKHRMGATGPITAFCNPAASALRDMAVDEFLPTRAWND